MPRALAETLPPCGGGKGEGTRAAARKRIRLRRDDRRMILFPAIDLKEGACVRLVRGDMDAATTFNPDPADQARRFVGAGCEWLHVVDLDGAFAGKAVNAKAVAAILDAVKVPVQL